MEEKISVGHWEIDAFRQDFIMMIIIVININQICK